MKKLLQHYRFRLQLGSIILVLLVLSIPHAPRLLVLVSVLLMVIAGINTVHPQHKGFHLLNVLGIASLVMQFIPEAWQTHPLLQSGLPQIAFILLLVVSQFHRVTHERPVTRELLFGMCALYLNFVLSFALAYNQIEQTWPHSFQSSAATLHVDSFVYFSMITLTTIGYGDIAPIHPLARLLAGSEAIMGVLFIALAVARGLNLMNED